MTREEATPGAVVVRVRADGSRRPGLYAVRHMLETGNHAEIVHVAPLAYVRSRVEPGILCVAPLRTMRLATADERREAGLEVSDVR